MLERICGPPRRPWAALGWAGLGWPRGCSRSKRMLPQFAQHAQRNAAQAHRTRLSLLHGQSRRLAAISAFRTIQFPFGSCQRRHPGQRCQFPIRLCKVWSHCGCVCVCECVSECACVRNSHKLFACCLKLSRMW